MGAGTINVDVNIYKDGGSAVFDYVFDHHFAGVCSKIGYMGKMSLQNELSFAREHKRLHLVPGGQGVGLFTQAAGIGAQLEEAYLHLFNHEDRLVALERENAVLKQKVRDLEAQLN